MRVPIRRPDASQPAALESGWDEGSLAESELTTGVGVVEDGDPVAVDAAMERRIRRAGAFC